jgi:NET1-associated nuclear protein 1 (U3 small nucleolar RNA-associated protein 17)
VGITNNHSVVLFGDDISSPVTEGSRANAVMGGAALGQRKTLFQDIFGASAFANLSHIPPSVDFNPMSRPPSSGNDMGGLFDAPAYLMPPIESLFGPLMDTFLKSRRKEDDNRIAEGNEHQDEDVEMAGQSDNEPVIVGERQERVVNQEEMDMFVKLFHQTKGSFFIF